VKNCELQLTRPRPLAEAISSAGGIRWSELDPTLMVQRLPGVFVAGEMIDWDAPTGGYLLQGCFATGTRAAHGALSWLQMAQGTAAQIVRPNASVILARTPKSLYRRELR
jgi:predicted flavoprotein YhiN